MTIATRPELAPDSGILGRVEGDYVAMALRLCPDAATIEGPHFVVVEAGRLGKVRIRCERIRSRQRAVWFWCATGADKLRRLRA